MRTLAEVASTRAVWLSDAASGLAQQMVLWGHDVRHPDGNWLVLSGMARRLSRGLTGTSCYSIPWEEGFIELHGAVASWRSNSGCDGCVYCRDRRRIELWCGKEAPVPGVERGSSGTPLERWQAFQPLLRWLVAYEKEVFEYLGSSWRETTWKSLRKLPHGPAWLPPVLALRWWQRALNGTPVRPRSLLLP